MEIKEVGSEPFISITFKDSKGKDCCLEEISPSLHHLIPPRIVLGEFGKLMWLNQEQVKELLPYLECFVKTGRIK